MNCMPKNFKESVYSKLASYIASNYSEEEIYILTEEILMQCLCDTEEVENILGNIESKLEIIVKIDQILKDKKIKLLN